MIKLHMFSAWLFAVVLGFALLVALTIAEFFLALFELPFDTWEVVKEKYEQIE